MSNGTNGDTNEDLLQALEQQLLALASEPKQATGDQASLINHDPTQLIALHKYLRGLKNQQAGGASSGMIMKSMFSRLAPPGAR